MMTALRTAGAWLAARPFSVFYALASTLLIASTLVDDVHPAYWIGAMFGFVVCPLLRMLLDERFARRAAESERAELERGMKEITETLRQGVERLKTSA